MIAPESEYIRISSAMISEIRCMLALTISSPSELEFALTKGQSNVEFHIHSAVVPSNCFLHSLVEGEEMPVARESISLGSFEAQPSQMCRLKLCI